MKFNKLTLGLLLLTLLNACQKELDDQILLKYCAIESLTLKDGNTGAAFAVYNYEYDSINRRPIVLRYTDLVSGESRLLAPTYADDTIYLGSNYLALDAGKRLVTLSETNAITGLSNGKYFYTYNSEGFIKERILDDGVNDAENTLFSFSGGTVSGYTQDFVSVPNAFNSSISYLSFPAYADFGQFAMYDIYPELMLYMPCFRIGRTPLFAMSAIKTAVAIPGSPITAIDFNYSNYNLTIEGWPSSFESDVLVNGVSAYKTKYEFTYRCYN